MKTLFLLFFILSLMEWSASQTQGDCSHRACTKERNPVCGQRLVNEKFECKIFANPCLRKWGIVCDEYEECKRDVDWMTCEGGDSV